MNRYLCTFILIIAAALSACSTAPSKQDQGVLIGAVIGGILGHQVGGGSGRAIATFVGTVAGSAIGGSIGQSMDETDRMNASRAFENVRTGVPTSWVNPDSRNQYTVVPTSTTETATGPCREYTIDAFIGGEPEIIYGVACRQADGSWQVQD